MNLHSLPGADDEGVLLDQKWIDVKKFSWADLGSRLTKNNLAAVKDTDQLVTRRFIMVNLQ